MDSAASPLREDEGSEESQAPDAAEHPAAEHPDAAQPAASASSEVLAVQDREGNALDVDQPSEADLLAFQVRLWDLLDRRVALYTSGESSSVPQLTAHRLLTSVLYVLGIDPDSLDAEEAHRLARVDLNAEFERGLDAVREKTQQCADLWQQVALSTPLLESTALKDTLTSIDHFLKSYDCRFFAAEFTADIDYPLNQPVPESLQGIDYIHEYLTRLHIENRFMNCFELSQEQALLKRVHPEYRELIINLFEPIATNAIGRALAGEDPRQLTVSEADRAHISALFARPPASEAKQHLAAAAETICARFSTEEADGHAYVRGLAVSLLPRIKAFADKEGLAGIFLTF